MQISESLTYAILVHFFGIIFLISFSAHQTMTRKIDASVSLVTEHDQTAEKTALRDNLRPGHKETKPAPPPESEKTMQENPTPAEVADENKDVSSESKPLQPVSQKPEEFAYADPEHGLASKVHEQLISTHSNAFVQDAGLVIDSFINVAVKEGLPRDVNDLTAQVNLRYDRSGVMTDVDIFSRDPKLTSLLAALNWGAVPLPVSYMVRFKALLVTVQIMQGVPRISVAAI
jgi:hypothetical protein